MSNSNREVMNEAMEEDEGGVFLGESDVLHVIDVDEEDLPDADDGDEEFGTDENDNSIHTFTGHEGEVFALACSPTDPTLVATGGTDEKGFLWRIGNGHWASELLGHKDSVASLAFSYDGRFLATGGLDGLLQIFNASSGAFIRSYDGGRSRCALEWVKWHPSKHIVVAASGDLSLWVWDVLGNEPTPQFLWGHTQSITCGDFTPDGQRICTGSADASLIVWNLITCKSSHVNGHPYHTDVVECLDINSNSTLAITGSVDGSVHIVNLATRKVKSSLTWHTDSVECVKFAPSSATIPMAATGGADNKLIIWDLQCSAPTPRFILDHPDCVTCVTWIGTSSYLVTGCADGTVTVWDSLSGNLVQTFHGHTRPVEAISVSTTTDFIVSISLDKTARAYETSVFKNKMA